MHHLPIVPILIVAAVIFGPMLLRMLKGGSGAGAGAGTRAGMSAEPRPNPRAAFMQMAEMARELDSSDPDAIKSLFTQVLGAQPGQFSDAPSTSMTFETAAVAAATNGFAQRLVADPVLKATLEKAKRKREKKREPKPEPAGRVSFDTGLGARDPLSPLAPLRPKKVLVPLPMLAARAPQRPIAF